MRRQGVYVGGHSRPCGRYRKCEYGLRTRLQSQGMSPEQRGFRPSLLCPQRVPPLKELPHCNAGKCGGKRCSSYTQKEWRADSNGLNWKALEHRKQEMTEIGFSPTAGA